MPATVTISVLLRSIVWTEWPSVTASEPPVLLTATPPKPLIPLVGSPEPEP